jgi:STE24 endopeptidase
VTEGNVPYLFSHAKAHLLFYNHTISYRQHVQLKTVVTRPRNIRPLMSEEDFQKTRVYGLDKSSFGFFASLCSQLIHTLVIFFDGLPLIWSLSGLALEYGLSWKEGHGLDLSVSRGVWAKESRNILAEWEV